MYKKITLTLLIALSQPLALRADLDNPQAAAVAVVTFFVGFGSAYWYSNATKSQESIEAVSRVEARHGELRKKFSEALQILAHPSQNQAEKDKAIINHIKAHQSSYELLPNELSKLRQEQIHSNNEIDKWKNAKSFPNHKIYEKQQNMLAIEKDCKEFEKLEQYYHRVKPYVATYVTIHDASHGIQGVNAELISVINARASQLKNPSERVLKEIWNDIYHALSRNGKDEMFLIKFIKTINSDIQLLDQRLRELKSSSAALIDTHFIKQAEELLENLKIAQSFVKKSPEYLKQLNLNSEIRHRKEIEDTEKERTAAEVKKAREQESYRLELQEANKIANRESIRKEYEAQTKRQEIEKAHLLELQYLRNGITKQQFEQFKKDNENLLITLNDKNHEIERLKRIAREAEQNLHTTLNNLDLSRSDLKNKQVEIAGLQELRKRIDSELQQAKAEKTSLLDVCRTIKQKIEQHLAGISQECDEYEAIIEWLNLIKNIVK